MLSKCKRFLSLLCAIVILIGTYGAYLIPIQSIVNAAENQVLDLDEDVKFFGRTFYEYDTSGKKVYKFSWANSGFQFSFKGKGATVTLQGYRYEENDAQNPYVKIYINGELATSHNISGATLDQGRIMILPNQDNEITISNLKEGNYTIKVVKCTDAYYNGISLSKIQLLDVDDIKGEILTTQKYYDRQILVIGDSLVSGYGTLAESQISNTTPYSTQAHEDSTLSFAALAADSFGAENMTIALRNRGIVKNASSTTTHLAKDFFEYLDFFENFNKRSVQYDHTKYNPDVVVISLGLHDAASSVSAATFKPACKDFILQVKSAYPDAKILYTYGFMDNTSNSLAATVKEVVSELNLNGYDDIFYLPLSACTDAEAGYQLSTNYYTPTKAAHAARAQRLILAIEDITDWKSSQSTSVPISEDMPADTLYRPMEDADISVMSFNVMMKNTSDQIYLDPSKRAPLIAQMIKAYMPDIICLQEATTILTGTQATTQLTIDGNTIGWAEYLTGQLEEVGYDCMWLTETVNNNDSDKGAPTMNIGSGLIIFWKADRFVSNDQNSGRTLFVPTGFGNAPYQGRYWMWVQLQDKHNMETSFYVYNTHVYSEPGASDTAQADVERMHIEMLDQLGSEITSNRANVPVFVAGDFVRFFNESPAGQGLFSLETGAIKDAAHAAPYTRQNDPEKTPNHIFFNSKYIDVRELHELYEGVEGRRLSSQEGIVAHFNFRGNVSFTGGTLSDDKSEFTAVTSGETYSLNVSVGDNVQADIYKDDGTAVYTGITGSQTLSLALENKKITHFTMRLKYGTGAGQTINVVNIYIERTDVSKPDLSATTNTVNCYFANGAYHLLAGNQVITLNVAGGELYWNPYATKIMTYFTLDLKQGRTVLYVKSFTTGDVYPVYIYRQTHTQALDKSTTSTIYVDDDFIANATGKVAFYDGERVIFVDASRAFATVEAAATAANGDGKLTTIYFGSGNYAVNQNYNGTLVKFTDDVILYGSNYDVSAVDPQADRWYAAGRRPESIINGGFYFEKSADISVTVKGFKFQGQTGYGALRFVDNADNIDSIMSHTQTLDIQNNTFMSSVDESAVVSTSDISSASKRGIVVAESQAKVTGIIKNNFFKCVQDDNCEDTNMTFTEALYCVNLNDMLIERNFFLGYQTALDIVDVKETFNKTSSTSYTVYSNRFEHCGSNYNRLFGVGANDKTYIAYRNNDFIRCAAAGDSYRGGGYRYAIDLYFDESKKGNLSGKVFENITIDIIGNRFMECTRSLRIRREKLTGTTYTNLLNKGFTYSNVEDMTVNFNKNAIINPLEYKYSNKTFNSIWLTAFSKGDMSSLPSSGDNNDTWDFSGNYCYSTFYDESSDYYEAAHENVIPETDAYGLYDLRKYMRNYTSGTTSMSVTLTDSNFNSKIHAYDRVVKAFDGAVGSFEDGWKYDFDHIQLPDTFDKSVEIGYDYDYISDIADMDFLRGTTPLSDKMTALDLLVRDDTVTYDELKKIDYHSMLTTEHLTGEMRGRTSFYSDVRWYCRNRVSFDIRTTYTGDEATFFYKYSNGAMSSGDYATITNEQFYNDSETDVDGIILKFKTKNNEPTILMRVYKTDKTYTEIEFNTTNSAVTDMREFNHIDIIEKEIGTMDFYVNGKCFARVVGTSSGDYSFTNGAIANTTNSSNAYYNTVTVYSVEQNEFAENVPVATLATVSNASVTKQSAIAFSSAFNGAENTANELWPEKMSMEIDNLEIVDLGVGKLTIINDIAAGILYKAWNMTDCTYDEVEKTYIYTVNNRWIDFFTAEEYKEIVSKIFSTLPLEDGRILVTFDKGDGNNQIEHDNADMVALAKAAAKYAIERNIEPVGAAKSKKQEIGDEYEAIIPLIDPGYFVVNSTLGSLITTDTYDNKDGTFNLTVYEKNDPPMIDKYVLEDSDQNWKKFNDTSIGEETQFKLLVTVQDGAFNYTIRDLYGEHFDEITVTSVKQYSSYDPASNSNPIVATYTADTHYTVNDDKSNNVLTIKFASSDAADNTVGSLEEVPSGNVIEVIYTAKALPSAPSEEAIQTSATLSYGRVDTDENLDPDLRVTEQFVTEETSVNTYLWSVNLFKYAEDDGAKIALSGAEFAISTDQAGTKKLSFIGSAGNYRVAASGETGATTKLVDDGNGNYTIRGLDSGIYYVVETAAPSGYARMSSPEPINIAVQNIGVELVRDNTTYTYDVNGDGTKDAFAFVNKPGFSLPSTGAAGRRMFIATGSVIVLSMSILLVTRMRSSKVIFIKTKVAFKKR